MKFNRSIADSDVGGTKDYGKELPLFPCKFSWLILLEGAPECYRSDDFLWRSKIDIKTAVDIWSFGGICSEAAAWVVLGLSGLATYRNQREQEIAGKKTDQDGCGFHDGENILQVVEDMHDRLRKETGEVRPRDHFTQPVVNDMISSMLLENPDERPSAIWLWRRSQRILKDSSEKLDEFKQPSAQMPSQNNPESSQQHNGPSNLHGPPPYDPKYDSDLQMQDLCQSTQQIPKRQSITWHEYNTGTEMSLCQRQSLGASPPLDAVVFEKCVNRLLLILTVLTIHCISIQWFQHVYGSPYQKF